MKPMKVVYLCETIIGYGDALRSSMGEESWSVGEKFDGEFMRGIVTGIFDNPDDHVTVEVDGKIAIRFPPHAVLRIYYGNEQ